MRVKDEKGRILTSKNPVIVGMWKKAGYEEVSGEERKQRKGKEPEKEQSLTE